MYLQRLSLINFRNYEQADLVLDPSFNAFVGDNGSGKTNLLDAIHYLSLCKSYFNSIDSQQIRHGEDYFMVQGQFDLDSREDVIACTVRKNQKKIFRRNQEDYERLSDHIGLLPLVMIAPTDTQLITEGSEERRRFMDAIISQYDRLYLDRLIRYERVLSQRNSLLKQLSAGRWDETTLSVLDEQLSDLAGPIYETRCRFIADLEPIFREYYTYISGGKEQPGIRYRSRLSEAPLNVLLQNNRERERALQYTSVGTHKDDLEFELNEFPVKRTASQGQQKSFLLALKLAQFDFLRKIKGVKPLLLLDDIFDKLDDRRVAALMQLVHDDRFGQVFITDTHPERIRQVFASIGSSIRCFPVLDGKVTDPQPENSPA